MKVNFFSEKNKASLFLSRDLESRGEHTIWLESGEAGLGKVEKALIAAGAGTGEDVDEMRAFLIRENEEENLKLALAMQQHIGELLVAAGPIDMSIYVFSSSDVARTILDSLDFCGINLRLIDPVETAVWNLMLDHPLYEARDRLQDEEIRVMIAGSGPTVPEIIKTVYWCGRMRLFRLKMNMIGGDMAHTETEMKFRCPGLFTQTMQENTDMQARGLVVPELYLPLRLTRAHYMQADTGTEAFEDALNKCLDTNYIIIDEGDDEATLRTAMAVRAHFIRKHILHESFLKDGNTGVTKFPGIYVYIRDERLAAAVPHLTVEGHPADAGNDELALVPFGTLRSVYTAQNIVYDPLDTLAQTLFPDEYAAETCSDGRYAGGSMPPSIRRMFRASALHLKYKLRDMNMIVRGESPDIYNTGNFPELRGVSERRAKETEHNLRFEMTALEHQAWTVFRLTDGWIPADAYHALGYGRLFKDGHREHRQFAGKMSAACVESSALSGTGTKLYGSPSHFTEYDRKTAVKTCSTIKAVYPEAEFAELVKMDFDD